VTKVKDKQTEHHRITVSRSQAVTYTVKVVLCRKMVQDRYVNFD